MKTLTQEQINAEAERRREIALAVLLALSEGVSQAETISILAAQAASRLEIGEFALDIAKITAGDQVRTVLESMIDAILAGTSFEQWKIDATSGIVDINLPAAQIATILRTNIQTAYNKGRYEQQMANKFDQPIWLYDAVNDSRTRETHAAMSGFMAPVDHPVWSIWYPPNGYNCRCSVVALSQEQAIARGYKAGTAPPHVQPDKGFGFNAATPGGLRTVAHAAVSSRPF